MFAMKVLTESIMVTVLIVACIITLGALCVGHKEQKIDLVEKRIRDYIMNKVW